MKVRVGCAIEASAASRLAHWVLSHLQRYSARGANRSHGIEKYSLFISGSNLAGQPAFSFALSRSLRWETKQGAGEEVRETGKFFLDWYCGKLAFAFSGPRRCLKPTLPWMFLWFCGCFWDRTLQTTRLQISPVCVCGPPLVPGDIYTPLALAASGRTSISQHKSDTARVLLLLERWPASHGFQVRVRHHFLLPP